MTKMFSLLCGKPEEGQNAADLREDSTAASDGSTEGSNFAEDDDCSKSRSVSKNECNSRLRRKCPKKKELASWSLRVCYQLCFVALLTAFLAALVCILYITLHPTKPRRLRSGSPGLGFRPSPTDPYSTLIHFKHGSAGNWKPLEASIKQWLKPYSHGKTWGSSIKCKWDTHIDEHIRCHVSKRRIIDWSTDYPCTKAENYGYSRGRPCVFLKVNKMYGWEPEPYYNLTEVSQLEGMPQWLKDTVVKTWEKKCKGKGREKEERCPNLRMVWMSCQGDTAADKENMGYIHYTQYPGFQGYYFPYLRQHNYLSPMSWIQFRDITPGVVIGVTCKLWAKNIRHDPRNPRIGGVHFEIMMD